MRALSLLAGYLLVLAMPTTPGSCQETAYAHNITLEGMRFCWEASDGVLHVKLAAKTTGWVGVGFNATKKMLNANIIIGYVKDGEAKVADHFGTTARQHRSDTKLGGKEHITGITGKEENGTTEIRFAIPLDSGDAKDGALTLDSNTTVLLAYGSGRDSFRSRHKFSATLKVNLKTGAYKVE